MKKQLLMGSLAAVVMAGASVPALAESIGAGFDVTANVGVVSDYIFRGVSQSNNSAAIQGGFDLKHSSGAYAGLWMSSLSGWYYTPAGYASTENDLYVGYGMNITKDIAVDLRYTDFVYGDVNHNGGYDEYHVAVSGYGATVGFDYGDNRSPGDYTETNLYGSYTYALPMDINLSATIGQEDLKDNFSGNTHDYAYYNIGVSKKAGGITWGLSYNDTNLSKTECSALSGSITNTTADSENACGSQIVLSATKAL